jgi:hypothetical protein
VLLAGVRAKPFEKALFELKGSGACTARRGGGGGGGCYSRAICWWRAAASATAKLHFSECLKLLQWQTAFLCL